MILNYRYRQSLDLSAGIDPCCADFLQLAENLLRDPSLASLADYTHHKHVTRLQHVVSVAYLSYCLGRKYHLDTNALVRGALLHDYYFYDHRLAPYPSFHLTRHPEIALTNALSHWNLTKAEKDIILHHMFPLGGFPHSREAALVSMIDKYVTWREMHGAGIPMIFPVMSRRRQRKVKNLRLYRGKPQPLRF